MDQPPSLDRLLRKTLLVVEETRLEGGLPATPPLRMVAAAAVLANPWLRGGFTADLRPAIQALAPALGQLLTPMILQALGGADQVQAYGKAAIVGVDGEVEHASALIHTLRFGNVYRQAVGGRSYLAFTNTRGGPGSAVMIPLMDKNDEGRRSHYLTHHFTVPDAPAAGEVLVALGAASGGRPHHRIGDRYQDLAEMGHAPDNPAGV